MQMLRKQTSFFCYKKKEMAWPGLAWPEVVPLLDSSTTIQDKREAFISCKLGLCRISDIVSLHICSACSLVFLSLKANI